MKHQKDMYASKNLQYSVCQIWQKIGKRCAEVSATDIYDFHFWAPKGKNAVPPKLRTCLKQVEIQKKTIVLKSACKKEHTNGWYQYYR